MVNVVFKCGSSQQENNCLAPFVWMCDAIKNLSQIIFKIILNNIAQQQIFNYAIKYTY